MIAVMGMVGAVSGLSIVATYAATRQRIAANRAAQLEEAVLRVVPGSSEQAPLHLATGERVFLASNSLGDPIGFAIEGSARGFQDMILFLYGYGLECRCITGFVILDSRETPGLGDRAGSDPGFLAGIRNLDMSLTPNQEHLQNAPTLVRNRAPESPGEITAISGATITSAAVVRGLGESADRTVPMIENQRPGLNPRGVLP
ncbi:MAG: FMN-binding protein [Spirochaetales bacterium]|nr:FMN-binding protein [Spirochaetales bacterium]MCP5484343.1 FMN-binding protein [Spirochaetales bacterium]